ncbi:unnamed protein product [Urochloa decumbens]|uniref:DUF1618 domain-containing protein n=1 Tax=Urochloa decumbens TaxID=240449 RepID=A0ABC8YYE1_9POAL
MAAAAASSSSAPNRWGIFATIPLVSADLPPGADLSLALAEPPAISILTLPRRISPDPLIDHRNFPSVLAADPSGFFLLHATQGPTDRTAGPVVYGDDLSARMLVTCRREFVHGYFLCDARSATAYRLPDPDDPDRILDAGNLGLLTRDGGRARTYLLAEVQPISGSDKAVLLRYSSETGRWTSKDLHYPIGGVVRPWASHGVFSLGERLWWCDVSWGLLTCFPFEEEPELEFVPIPRTASEKLHSCPCTSRKHIQFSACFAISDGLRIGVPARPKVVVQRVKRPAQRHGAGKDPWIVMYSLRFNEDSDSWVWNIDHEVSFEEEIWCHHTYEASGLPKERPKLACVDPFNANLVFFFLGRYIFSIDLTSAALLKCTRYGVKRPTKEHMSSRYVLACPF